jgi:hypothetical protein
MLARAPPGIKPGSQESSPFLVEIRGRAAFPLRDVVELRCVPRPLRRSPPQEATPRGAIRVLKITEPEYLSAAARVERDTLRWR